MEKSTNIIFAGLLSIAVLYTFASKSGNDVNEEKSNYSADEQWATEAVFDVPESVCYYPEDHILFVANIVGKPTVKDGEGFISKLSMNGEIVELEWFKGLDAPKGMGIFNGKLYVTNIDEVVAIDIETAKELQRWKCEGAKFANDIAINDEGVVFISGMQNGALYRLAEGEITKWQPMKSFTRPNGLWAGDKYLYAGAAKHIYRMKYTEGKIERYIENSGGVDGLEQIKEDYFLKSDWTGHVHVVSTEMEKQLILNTADKKINAADIEYVPAEKLMLVPTFFDNRVVAYEIKKK